jgi:hypothetical protein
MTERKARATTRAGATLKRRHEKNADPYGMTKTKRKGKSNGEKAMAK